MSVPWSVHSRCFSRSKLNYPFIPVCTNIHVFKKKKTFICSTSYWDTKPDTIFYMLGRLVFELISQFTSITMLYKKNSFSKFTFKFIVTVWRRVPAVKQVSSMPEALDSIPRKQNKQTNKNSLWWTLKKSFWFVKIKLIYSFKKHFLLNRPEIVLQAEY